MGRLIIIDDEPPPAASTYIAAADNGGTNSTSHSVAIGIGAEPNADEQTRLVAIAVQLVASSASNPSISAATIGGITATVGTSPGTATGASGRFTTYWIWAEVQTGTSATVALTLSSSALLRMRSFRVVGLLSFTPTNQNGSGLSGTASSLATSIDVLRDGVALAVCHGVNSVDNWTISGVTQDFSADNVGGPSTQVVGGHFDATADETARNITVAFSSASTIAGLAAISFR